MCFLYEILEIPQRILSKYAAGVLEVLFVEIRQVVPSEI